MSIYTNTIVKAHSRKAIQIICKWLPVAFDNPKSVEAREKMAYAEFMAGTAFNSASLGFIHSLSHAMSAIFNTPHGLANAVLMPYVMDYELRNRQAVIHIAKLATYMGLTVDSEHIMDKAKAVIEFIIHLLKKTKTPTNLNDVQPNISKTQITSMAKKAMKDFCGISNIIQFSRREVKHIYKNAINGHFDHINMKG
jgi:alcohol dehydrogenase